MIDRVRPVVHFLRCARKYGLGVATSLYAPSGTPGVTMSIPNLLFPFEVPRSRVGRRVFDGVLVQEQYRPRTIELRNVRYIVDAGAHIGLASVYFANRFPSAQILSIEPSERNFATLVKNTARYPGVIPFRNALWHRQTNLEISNPDGLSWAFRVKEQGDGTVPSVTIPELLSRFGWDRIDILKLDIEGAEKELFENGGAEWLPRVRCLAIELHDRFKPGGSKAVFEVAAACRLRHEHRKEVDFFISAEAS